MLEENVHANGSEWPSVGLLFVLVNELVFLLMLARNKKGLYLRYIHVIVTVRPFFAYFWLKTRKESDVRRC